MNILSRLVAFMFPKERAGAGEHQDFTLRVE